MNKTKLIVEQGFYEPTNYTVVKLVNRVLPEIGHVLKREELQKLMTETVGMEVQILPSKRQKQRPAVL